MLRFFKMIGHGTLMMVRTLRNYAMLSMSVVLSFSCIYRASASAGFT